jgi:HSP20 family protein
VRRPEVVHSVEAGGAPAGIPDTAKHRASVLARRSNMEKPLTKVPAKKEETFPVRTPWGLFEELRNEMEELWNRPWLPFRFARTPKTWMPSTDVFRANGDLVVRADLPGMKKEDIEIRLEGGDLVMKGERKHEETVKEENLFRSECSYGSFFRRLPLPYEVAPEKINAKFADGVLEVHIPLPKEELTKVEKIPIF